MKVCLLLLLLSLTLSFANADYGDRISGSGKSEKAKVVQDSKATASVRKLTTIKVVDTSPAPAIVVPIKKDINDPKEKSYSRQVGYEYSYNTNHKEDSKPTIIEKHYDSAQDPNLNNHQTQPPYEQPQPSYEQSQPLYGEAQAQPQALAQSAPAVEYQHQPAPQLQPQPVRRQPQQPVFQAPPEQYQPPPQPVRRPVVQRQPEPQYNRPQAQPLVRSEPQYQRQSSPRDAPEESAFLSFARGVGASFFPDASSSSKDFQPTPVERVKPPRPVVLKNDQPTWLPPLDFSSQSSPRHQEPNYPTASEPRDNYRPEPNDNYRPESNDNYRQPEQPRYNYKEPEPRNNYRYGDDSGYSHRQYDEPRYNYRSEEPRFIYREEPRDNRQRTSHSEPQSSYRGLDFKIPDGFPDPHKDPRAQLKREYLGAKNDDGKPWGEKVSYVFKDPKNKNNYVEVSEVRMTVNNQAPDFGGGGDGFSKFLNGPNNNNNKDDRRGGSQSSNRARFLIPDHSRDEVPEVEEPKFDEPKFSF